MNRIFFLAFFVMLASIRLACQVTNWGTSVIGSIDENGCDGDNSCREITFSQIPFNLHGYNCFINYGDGIFEKFDTVVSQLESPFSIIRKHKFAAQGKPNVILQLTPYYDDEDKPTKIVANGSTNVSVGGSPIYKIDDNINLIHSVLPRAGDNAFYVLTFSNSCDSSAQGSIEFIFNPDLVEVVSHPVSTPGYLIFPYVDLDPGDPVRNVFLELHFKNEVDAVDSVIFEVKMNGLSCATNQTEETFKYDIVKSHDPNHLKAEKDSVCTIPPDSLTYYIVFQNIGRKAAEYVKVVDIIPEYFVLENEESVHMIKKDKHHKDVPFKVDATNRTITWFLRTSDGTLKQSNSNNLLRGTGEDDYKLEFRPIGDTEDTIAFRLAFNKNVKLPACGVIVNRAEIFFDKNPSMFTNDFFTKVMRDENCSSCSNDFGKIIEVGPFICDGTNSKRLNLLDSLGHNFDESYEFVWYPSLWLENIYEANPVIKADSNMVYTVVITKDGSKQLVKVSVLVDKSTLPDTKSSEWDWKWFWWVLLLIPLIGWAFIRKRNS